MKTQLDLNETLGSRSFSFVEFFTRIYIKSAESQTLDTDIQYYSIMRIIVFEKSVLLSNRSKKIRVDILKIIEVDTPYEMRAKLSA